MPRSPGEAIPFPEIRNLRKIPLETYIHHFRDSQAVTVLIRLEMAVIAPTLSLIDSETSRGQQETA